MLTRSLSTWAVCGLALAALLAAPAAVSAEDDQTFKWSNGFSLESKEKGYALKFGGRIQADYTFASGDTALEDGLDDGFEFRRSRLFFSGKIYHRIKFKAQYDFAGGSASFKDVWIGITNDVGELRFGHYKEYFSLEELTSSKYLAFVERSMPVEAFSPSRNSGVGFHGSNGDRINWGVGYFYDADGFGVSGNGDNTNITGRIAFRPVYEDGGKRLLHVGVAASSKERGTGEAFRFRARPEAHFTTRFVDTGSFESDSATLLGIEVAGVFNRFWFAAEHMQMDVDSPPLGDPSFDGYYAQAGIYLTNDYRRFKTSDGAFNRQKPGTTFGKDGKGAMELVARVSNLNLDDGLAEGGEQDNVTLGFNWYLNPATRFMLNWVNADVAELGSADFVLMRWQVDF
jgi:phosphate-selective porin OprO/OprP